jgi:hypothetical protein
MPKDDGLHAKQMEFTMARTYEDDSAGPLCSDATRKCDGEQNDT